MVLYQKSMIVVLICLLMDLIEELFIGVVKTKTLHIKDIDGNF